MERCTRLHNERMQHYTGADTWTPDVCTGLVPIASVTLQEVLATAAKMGYDMEVNVGRSVNDYYKRECAEVMIWQGEDKWYEKVNCHSLASDSLAPDAILEAALRALARCLGVGVTG